LLERKRPLLLKGSSRSRKCDRAAASYRPFVALDILQRVADKDREYFRSSREQRIGKTLEAFVANRDAGLAGFRANLAPLRATLKTQPFFAGDEPFYADYALFSPLQWARCISPFALLEDGDPVRVWRDRLLDRFEGLVRNALAYDV
jgi:glutathione S-transferase